MPNRIKLTKCRRRGLSSVTLVLAFAAIVALMALGIDLGLLVQRHEQLKTAGEAASLAAAHELFDPRVADDTVDRELLARQAALSFAAANMLSDQPLKLQPNRTNDPRGDVVLGWMNPPELLGKFSPQTKQQPHVNALLIRTRHSQTGRIGPLLTLGRMVGVSPTNLRTESIAAVDHRLSGFRPVACTNVPMLPLLVESRFWGEADDEGERGSDHDPSNGHGDNEHGDDENHREDGQGQVPPAFDRFTVDPRAGVVVPGGDGIAEFRITFGPRQQGGGENQNDDGGKDKSNKKEHGEDDGQSPHANSPLPGWFIDLTGHEFAAVLPHEIRWGLCDADLAGLRGQINLGSQVVCLSVGAAVAEGLTLDEVDAALQSIIGQPRVFALGAVGAGSGACAGTIVNFAAGVVVESQRVGSSLTIWVQPVVLNSCTAVIDNGVEANPWIGKVVLVR